eukprot:scaffold270_cov121-Isochrysis_galbana.AAC.20
MSSEAIDYVKKPAIDFIKDSWRLVKRCTKPDRNGAPLLRPLHGHTGQIDLGVLHVPALRVVCAAPPWTGGAPLLHQRCCSALRFLRDFTERAHPPPACPHAEFSKIAQATSVGFFIMGFIGFFVKLIFIPINNIIVGMS